MQTHLRIDRRKGQDGGWRVRKTGCPGGMEGERRKNRGVAVEVVRRM